MKRSLMLAQVLLLTACGAVVLAEDKANDNKKNFQEYVEKFGTPGPEHKLLEPLVGTFQTRVKCWMDPAETPQVSEGAVQRKSKLDGRFICEEVEGKFNSQPYHGFGTIGFDRAKKKFVYSWIDSMSTAIKIQQGTYDEGTKTWTFKMEETCPITGKPVRMRDTLRLVSANEQLMEMYRQLGDEKEMKVMEINFTRTK